MFCDKKFMEYWEMPVTTDYVWIPGNMKLFCLNKLFGMIKGRKMVIDSIDLQFSKMGQLHVMPMIPIIAV